MKKIITIIIFVLAFGKTQAQTQWNVVPTPNDTIATHYSHFLNVIDSLTVVLTPKYTYDTPSIIKTTDAGQTWTYHLIDSTMFTILHEVEFIDANVGYIVGGTDFGNWNVLLKTTDGGATWQNIDTSFFPTVFPTSISEISFVTDQIGFIVRNGENTLYRTTNGGVNFTALNLPPIQNDIYSFVTEIRFISPYVGFVTRMQTGDHVNGTTEILRTTNGGNSWTLVNTTNWQDVNTWEKKDKIQFVNDLQGFAIVGTGVLKVTQDTGNSWTERNLPLTTPPPTDFYFVNNATGYLALDGNIYRTDDAGQSWSLQTIENSLNNVNYIQFATENYGYALNYEYPPQGQGQGITLLNTNQQPATPLSVESFDFNNQFTVYPNPANEFIHIQNNSNLNIQYIHLIDMRGKIVRTFENDFESLNVSAVAEGNYVLFIQTNIQKIVKKVIVR